jgi:hypothetical protein
MTTTATVAPRRHDLSGLPEFVASRGGCSLPTEPAVSGCLR